MNRRQVIYYSGIVLSACGINGSLSQRKYKTTNIEETLLSYYEQSFFQLQELFPKIKFYSQALKALEEKGLLLHDKIITKQLTILAKTDPIIDFLNWQYTESELLLYYSSYLLMEKYSIQKI